jgi:hypothetical protein
MVTKKAAAKTTKSVPAKPVTSKQPGKSLLALNRKNVLTGDLPTVLDLREITLKHKGEIRIAESDLVESIHLPDGEFSNVVIADLPNLREIHAHGMGPTWMDCQNLPNLQTLVVEGGTRWLNVDQAAILSDIDVGKCEHLGVLSIQHAPMLSKVNIEQCRLLPTIQGMSTEDQDRLGLTRQMGAVQAMSKRDSNLYPRMTCTDIELLLENIRRGEVLLKKQFPTGDEEIDVINASPSYSYRLLQPGEKAYTGGTGESYCYAFEVTTQETKGKKLITHILEERGIHEPEAAIGEALRRVASGLGVARNIAPSEDQVLTYLNLLLSAPDSDPVSWIKTEDLALRLALAANPLMPTPALGQLANDQDPNIRLAVAENPASEFQVRQRLLHGLVSEKDPATRMSVARSAATAPEDLETLSKDSDVETLCAIAQNPVSTGALRVAALETLSTCGESIGLLLVASSSDAPEHLFAYLLKSSDKDVLVAISENIGAPEFIRSAALEQLASSDDPQVKQSVARNKLTPPAVLDSLTQGADSRLLAMISKNPVTPVDTLEFLAKSDDWDVRFCVADNPSTPSSALLILSKDRDALGGEYIRKSVAGNPATPQEAFKFLVKDKDWHTRAAIAKNMAAPKDILEILAKDKEYSVREGVARNFAAPASALEILGAEKNDNIKMFVARNPNSSADTLTRLATDLHYATRRDVAANTATPNSVLQMLLKDAEQQVRIAAEKSLGKSGSGNA